DSVFFINDPPRAESYPLSLHDALPICDGEAAFGRKIRRTSHGVPVDTARMREVESENERLKRILGEKELEIAILRDLLKKRGSQDRKSTRLNSSHVKISYAVFCLKKKK